jgi:hypothetical protein
MQSLENIFLQAFYHNDPYKLRSAHLLLNTLYYALMYGEDETILLDENMQERMKMLEEEWIGYDKTECLAKYDFNCKIADIAQVETALKRHGAYHHYLFDYLSLEATEDEIKKFILNESVLNIEFFDYLALSVVGVQDHVKAEIMGNLWDEAGQGNIHLFHTNLFKKLLNDLDLPYKRDVVIANMCWEGLAGINLFNYFARHPFNKMKYFGLLAATEMLDPDHYLKFMQGMNRVFSGRKVDCTYYLEHQLIDIQHANGWLKNVILPELERNPEKITDFWLGFYMRLDSVQRYYDELLHTFLNQKAA